MSNTLIIGGGDGAGGLTLAFQCAYIAKRSSNVFVGLSCSDEIFRVLKYLFEDEFNVHLVPLEYSQNHKLLHDESIIKSLADGYDYFYYVCPDLLFRNKYAFDFNYWGTNLSTLKTTRLLTHRCNVEDIIYVGLNSSTPGYFYDDAPQLVDFLSEEFPNKTIYVPVLDSWADIKLNTEQWNRQFDSNVVIDKNPDFVESIKMLEKSEICICGDNGISHISYHLGQQRVLLDPRFGWKRDTLMWRVRWRQTDDDSLPITTKPLDVVKLIKLNQETPQTQLIPKNILYQNLHGVDWSREMLFKF